MKRFATIAVIGLFSVLLNGCTSGTTASSGPLVISGTWSGGFLSEVLSLDPDVNPSETLRISAVVTLTINQDEEFNLTGIAVISDPETNCFTGGNLTGKITGSSYTITITDGFGSTITLTGEATINTMNGVYSATATAGRCPAHTGEANFNKQ